MLSGDTAFIGIGLAGTGVAGGMHARALRRTDSVRLVAVADVDWARARAFADEWRIPQAYGDVQQMLSDPAVAAVHLCTPPGLHESLTRACASAGKHVLVEKPMARNLAEADSMIRACDEAGVWLAAIFNQRFMPLPRKLKDALYQGVLGRLFLAEGHVKWWRPPEYYSGSRWRGSEAGEGGGVLINQAIHTVDLLHWLVGPVAEVTGHTTRGLHDLECEDTAVAVMRFEQGAVATLTASTAVYPGSSDRLEIFGSEGSVVLAGSDGTMSWSLRGGRRWQDTHDGSGEASLAGHVAQFEDFATAIRDGRPPAVDGAEGRKALELVRAFYAANRRGAPVRLPLHEDG